MRHPGWLAAAVIVGVGAVAFGLAGFRPSRRGEGPEADGVDLHLGVGVGDDHERPWLCQPSDMTRVLDRPHPLYRRPGTPRPAAAALAGGDWRAWYLNPPSEQGL